MFISAERWRTTYHLKCSLKEILLAQQTTDITRSLSSLQIPFIDAYTGIDPRGILNVVRLQSRREATGSGKWQVNISSLWSFAF